MPTGLVNNEDFLTNYSDNHSRINFYLNFYSLLWDPIWKQSDEKLTMLAKQSDKEILFISVGR